MAANENEALKIVGEELEALKERIIQNHRAAGQVASGRTARSLFVEPTERGAVLWGRRAFGTLETGRKGGRVPRGFYHIILQWVQDKGINVENPESFAYLVSRKIAKEGTLLYREGGRADIYSNEIPEAIKKISKRLHAYYGLQIDHINLNSNSDENK